MFKMFHFCLYCDIKQSGGERGNRIGKRLRAETRTRDARSATALYVDEAIGADIALMFKQNFSMFWLCKGLVHLK